MIASYTDLRRKFEFRKSARPHPGPLPQERGASRRTNVLREYEIGNGHAISASSPDSVRAESEGGSRTGGLVPPGTKPGPRSNGRSRSGQLPRRDGAALGPESRTSFPLSGEV